MNALITEDTHLHEDEHDLKGHERSHKAVLIHLLTNFDNILASTNIVKLQIFLKIKYDLRSHRTTFMLWRGCEAFLLFSDFLFL